MVKATLTEANIAQTFEAAKVPHDVDYVSIDVDSIDFWLLKGLIAPDSPTDLASSNASTISCTVRINLSQTGRSQKPGLVQIFNTPPLHTEALPQLSI